ncbi:MAG: histidine phosphatase family protein [Alphaproteobacteria bacterium]|nr:histidine phosphatase family protein [Alphaproteobacteria bacterium]
MTPLALIRHAPTAWNSQGRIQGQTDVPLDAAGARLLSTWRLPDALQGFVWTSSPLQRATETAHALGAPADMSCEPRLMEMHWGEWEGRTLVELRQELGEEMADNEARGLDFRPPGGESPRDLQARLQPWLRDRGEQSVPTIAVTHKGVIRAILALATDWDMTDKPPVKLSRSAVHLFMLDETGTPVADRLNMSLKPES